MKNWKTTLGGVLAAIGLLLSSGLVPLGGLSVDVAHQIGGGLAALGAFITGNQAKDKSAPPTH